MTWVEQLGHSSSVGFPRPPRRDDACGSQRAKNRQLLGICRCALMSATSTNLARKPGPRRQRRRVALLSAGDAIGHLLVTAFWLPCLRHPCIRGDQSLVGLKEAALSHCVDTARQALCEADCVCSGVCSALRRKPDTLRRGSCFSVRGPSLPPNSAQRGDVWGHSPRSLRLLDLRGCEATSIPCCGFCGCAMSRPSLSSTTIPCGGVNGHSPNRFDSSACPKRAALLAFSSGSGDGHRRRTADVVSAAVLSFPSLSRHPRGPLRSPNPQTLFCSCHVSTSV